MAAKTGTASPEMNVALLHDGSLLDRIELALHLAQNSRRWLISANQASHDLVFTTAYIALAILNAVLATMAVMAI